MNDEDALAAARRHVKDAIDAIDQLDDQSFGSTLAAFLLTVTRFLLSAAEANVDSEDSP